MHTHVTDAVSAQALSGFFEHPTHDRRKEH